MEEKRFVDEHALMLDGFRLGKMVFDSGFRPDFIVGIWRGGSSVGIVVQECLQFLGVNTDHIAIRTSYQGAQSYTRMIHNADKIRVHGIDYLEDRLEVHHKVLLVDDVYSSGLSMQAVLNKLRRKLRQNMPEDIRVAVVWQRPRQGSVPPDYVVNQTGQWLVLPYELTGLSDEEIARHKPWVQPMLDKARSR